MLKNEGLKDKIPPGKKSTADKGYRGEEEKISMKFDYSRVVLAHVMRASMVG
jgi:hypothetical protein